MFIVRIDSNKAWVLTREVLTRYSEGYDAVQVEVDFDSAWSSLGKTAVFRADDAQISVAMGSDRVEIPVQVLLKPNVHLLFGVYGVNEAGTVVIPTVWTDLGIIQNAPDPTASDNYGPPATGLLAQVQALAKAAQEAAETAASGVYSGSVTFEIGAGDSAGHLVMTRTTNGVATTTDLGPVTAYAQAIANEKFSGTLAEFLDLLTANAKTSYDVAGAKSAATAASTAAAFASAAAAEAAETAEQAATSASSAYTAATSALTAANTKQPKHKEATVTLVSGQSTWNNLSAEGVTANNLVIWGPAPESVDDAADVRVRMTAQGANVVSFSALAAPESAITINLAIFD